MKYPAKYLVRMGNLWVTLPTFLIFLAIPSLFLYLWIIESVSFFMFAISIPINLLLTYKMWSKLTISWLRWAYRNAEDLNDLKRRASDSQLIYSGNKHITQAFIDDNDAEMKMIELNLVSIDASISTKDDNDIPNELLFEYNDNFTLSGLIFIAIIITTILVIYFTLDLNFDTSLSMLINTIPIILVLSLVMVFRKKKISHRLLMNSEGIEADSNFYSWEEIKSVAASRTNVGNKIPSNNFISIRLKKGNTISTPINNNLHLLGDISRIASVYKYRFYN